MASVKHALLQKQHRPIRRLFAIQPNGRIAWMWMYVPEIQLNSIGLLVNLDSALNLSGMKLEMHLHVMYCTCTGVHVGIICQRHQNAYNNKNDYCSNSASNYY